MDKYKSPIKAKALRNPGQSIEAKIQDIIWDKVLYYVYITTILSIFAMLEWLYWYLETPRSPWLFTVSAIIAIIITVFKFIPARKSIKKYRQGLDGERAVGQYLDKLQKNDCDIFHDIVFDGFNIDHVVISKRGIFCIETKTYSKPVSGETKLFYDGITVEVNGFKASAPVIQVKAASKTLQELLEQSTGKKFTVNPVLLFPGWFVECKNKEAMLDVWALNPQAFKKFILNENESLSADDAQLAAYHLSRHVRSI